MSILEAKDQKKVYGEGENAVHALDGVNLQVENGEFVAIVGTSGSGKSTLLHMLGGLDRPTSGKVYVNDVDIAGLTDDALTIFRRRKIGFVFQAFNLVPVLNVYENVILPMELDGVTLRVFDADLTDTHTDAPAGTLLRADREGIEIACAGGETIRITSLQAPGKKRMSAADYLRGHPVRTEKQA